MTKIIIETQLFFFISKIGIIKNETSRRGMTKLKSGVHCQLQLLIEGGGGGGGALNNATPQHRNTAKEN